MSGSCLASVAALALSLRAVLCADMRPRRRRSPKQHGAAQFRVCADPENMPFSNQKLEGFENRIAALIAKDFGSHAELHLVGAATGVHPEHDERDARRKGAATS